MARERPVDIGDLLSHAAWLRRLANHLVKGTGEGAGDLVQETWVAALRAPPSGERSTRPWLAEVLRNAFRRRRRDGVRLARREAGCAAQDLDSPSPEHLLERAEAQRQLGQLVLELEEPYRTTVLLRYFEDLAPVEIARLMNEPAGTVRWRLSEAHRKLRAAIAREGRSERGGALGALIPLLPDRGSLWSGLSMKGVAMAAVVTAKTKAGVAALAVVLLALGLGVRSQLNDRAPAAATSPVAPGKGTPQPTPGQAGVTPAARTASTRAQALPRLQTAGASAATSIIYGPSRDITFDELPPRFQAVVSEIALRRPITEVKERRDILPGGRIRTRVKFDVDGVRHEVMLDEQGKLVASEVDFKIGELPTVVVEGIKAAFPEATIVKADRQWRDDRPVYFDVNLTTLDGRPFELHVSEEGRITKTSWK
jgi:RNA polymerase sigma-70 factor (ECF subfamily)